MNIHSSIMFLLDKMRNIFIESRIINLDIKKYEWVISIAFVSGCGPKLTGEYEWSCASQEDSLPLIHNCYKEFVDFIYHFSTFCFDWCNFQAWICSIVPCFKFFRTFSTNKRFSLILPEPLTSKFCSFLSCEELSFRYHPSYHIEKLFFIECILRTFFFLSSSCYIHHH